MWPRTTLYKQALPLSVQDVDPACSHCQPSTVPQLCTPVSQLPVNAHTCFSLALQILKNVNFYKLQEILRSTSYEPKTPLREVHLPKDPTYYLFLRVGVLWVSSVHLRKSFLFSQTHLILFSAYKKHMCAIASFQVQILTTPRTAPEMGLPDVQSSPRQRHFYWTCSF